ncbi:pilus assembly protein PilM [Nannocystis sp.]|uniref:pilus assembly protein PilM n=1 Tax=Nannocystis sp. TaxID=1962667 RepID=UPI0024277EFC|nr:pilus assembly protein PilM [Nannocystis sp.]MBK7830460.1 pilus assembly protein PilM [Nannocystis sp.]MBK9757209.1 pilus assembly protein PilM [Nannocystis sp.]
MAQKYVGLDLGTHEVKAVLVSAGLRATQVLEVAVEPVPARAAGDDGVSAALEQGLALLRRRGWNHYRVGVVLPGSAASFRVLKFPFADARRIAQAIAFEAEGQFPVPLEELEYDHIPLATGSTGQALMVAVRRDTIDKITRAFKAASVDLKLITVDAIAITQVLDSAIPELVKTEPTDSRIPAVLLLDIGHHTTDLVAFGAKGPLAARVLRRGGAHVTRALQDHYRLDPAAAERAKIESGFLPHRGQGELSAAQLESASLVARAIEPIVREVEHTRLWLRAEFGVEITQIRVSGGGAQLRGLDAYFAEQVGLPTLRARPRDNLGGGSLHGHDWTGTSAALGAAVGCARRPLIQLFKDINTQRGGDGSWLVERMATIGALGLVILALAAIDTMVKISALESERQAREDELGAASARVFGESLTAVEDIEARLNEVDGEDITSLIASRGAVDVLGAFVKATVPAGPKPPPAPPPPAPAEGGEAGDGEVTPAPAEAAPAAPLPAVDLNAGIAWDDDLQVASIEIRPLAIQFRASATRTTTQDRLKTRLMSSMPCVTSFPNARLRDENERKVFDATLEHDCYFKSLEAES